MWDFKHPECKSINNEASSAEENLSTSLKHKQVLQSKKCYIIMLNVLKIIQIEYVIKKKCQRPREWPGWLAMSVSSKAARTVHTWM